MIDLKELLTKILQRLKNSLNLERGSSIPANSNLNNYTTLGNYYVASAAVSATISNTPTTGAGYSLIVYTHYGNLPAQIAISKGINGDNRSYPIFFRSQFIDSNNAYQWTDWVRLTTEDPDSPVGTYKSVAMGSGNKSIANGTQILCTSLSLEPGTWMITGQIMYQNGGTAGTYRAAYLGTSSATSGLGNVQVASSSAGNTNVQVSSPAHLNATTTITLHGQQGSGSAINIAQGSTYLRAIRIK